MIIDRDFGSFMENQLSQLVTGIDLDHSDLVSKKSELFTFQFLKDSKGKLVKNEPVHNIMHRFIRYAQARGFNKYLILGAFGHGKTEQICTGYVLHRIAQNPNLLAKIVHVSEPEAVKRCRAIRDIIAKDDDFKAICPHIRPTQIWGSQRFIVQRKAMSKDGTVEAYGVMSTAIGGRANLLVFDDPQDLKTAVLEPVSRKKIEDTFKNIWLTRLIPEAGEALVMMNKWHENDLASFIQGNPVWSWMQIAVAEDLNSLQYKDSFGRTATLPLWSKFNKKSLMEKRGELGQRDFDRGYRLIPYPDNDKTFPSFKKCCQFGIDPHSIIEHKNNWLFLGGIDFSSTHRPGTVMSIIGVNRKSGLKLPVEVVTLRGSQEIPAYIIKFYQKYGADFYYAENNGVQDAIIDMLISSLGTDTWKRYKIKIEGFLTGKNKADPMTGLPSLEKEFENQEWMFCFDREPSSGEVETIDPWMKLYHEFAHHPFWETTDIVMSMWFAREAAKLLLRGSGGPNCW
jgi:hypothetical protein